MDKIVLLPSVCIGLLLVVWYAIRCHRLNEDFQHATMTMLVLNASGFVCGLTLVASSIFEDLRHLISGMDLYIFIAGLTVTAVSVQSIARMFMKATNSVASAESKATVTKDSTNQEEISIQGDNS